MRLLVLGGGAVAMAMAADGEGGGCCEWARKSGVYEELDGMADEECCRLVGE